ncbi:hypothetical protein [Salinactinospora qingdaonensis]|uniref:SWIM-type domain-containing protein n=1 Tax=Salinactinospora qingdaonensis TaxID=702744 RepID=A0ABP7FY04_9ACTN
MEGDAVDTERADFGQRSGVNVVPPARARKLAKVPFVELADGRLQGVVSSGSDTARVYVSSITAGSHALNCGTNNNRPCGGLSQGGACKHLDSLVNEAVLQYGAQRVADYLQAPAHLREADDAERSAEAALRACLEGKPESTPPGVVFGRFLRYLSYLEVPGTTTALPEMHWFPATGADR